MLKLVFVLFILFGFTLVSAQNLNIKKTVFDSQIKTAIPYSIINVLNTLRFKDADKSGLFDMNVNMSDTILITCIGYKEMKISVDKIIVVDSIFLNPMPITLEAIIISKPLIKTFGLIDKKIERSCVSNSVESRAEMATLIEVENQNKPYRLSKVFFMANRFNSENPVRLHIYEVEANGLPGNELLTKEIVITKNDLIGKKVIINLKDQNIIINEKSFFVSVQWLTSKTLKRFTGPEFFETGKVKKLHTYRRQLNIKNNQWFGGFKKSMIFYPEGVTPNDDAPINLLASAEIEIFDK